MQHILNESQQCFWNVLQVPGGWLNEAVEYYDSDSWIESDNPSQDVKLFRFYLIQSKENLLEFARTFVDAQLQAVSNAYDFVCDEDQAAILSRLHSAVFCLGHCGYKPRIDSGDFGAAGKLLIEMLCEVHWAEEQIAAIPALQKAGQDSGRCREDVTPDCAR